MRAFIRLAIIVLVAQSSARGDQWEVKAPYPVPTGVLGAAAVGSRIYAIGGINSSNVVDSVYEYDTIANTWTPQNTDAIWPSQFCNCGGQRTNIRDRWKQSIFRLSKRFGYRTGV
jgi:N-acetylneuraminic acid mutarotase